HLDGDAAHVESFFSGELAEDLLLDAGVGKPVAGRLARFRRIFLRRPGARGVDHAEISLGSWPNQRTVQERVALPFPLRPALPRSGNFRSLSFTGPGSMKETGSIAGKLSPRAWSSFSSTLALRVCWALADMSLSVSGPGSTDVGSCQRKCQRKQTPDAGDHRRSRVIAAATMQQNGCISRRGDLHPPATRRLHMSDRIEKTIELKAPVARVWKALTDHHEFGKWFKVRLEGPFVPGKVSRGQITHPGYEHVTWQAVVQKMEPERLFSFTWHPYAIDPQQDYSGETPTLVEFSLEKTATGTRLT